MENWEDQLDRIDAAELRVLMEAGAISSRHLANACHRQIDALDEKVNAVIERTQQ